MMMRMLIPVVTPVRIDIIRICDLRVSIRSAPTEYADMYIVYSFDCSNLAATSAAPLSLPTNQM